MREIVCVRAREIPAGNHSARAFYICNQYVCVRVRVRMPYPSSNECSKDTVLL